MNNINRRNFIFKFFPGCALSCIISQKLFLSSYVGDNAPKQNKHKFEEEINFPLSNKNWMKQRHMKYIGILKHLQNYIGKEKLIKLLKKASYEENVELGKIFSKKVTDMNTFARPFRSDNSRVGSTIVRKIIKDNDKVFEMKITQCLVEEVFREANARDLGYACVCHADFGLPEGMDINIRLIRSSTLMQGNNCCNHKYKLYE